MHDELLIEQVSGFPALFDKSDARYKSKVAKEAAWTTIAAIVNATPEKCCTRWTVLRAKYTKLKREIKAIPSGSEAYEIGWPHFSAMEFIDPFLTTRKTTSNMRTVPTSGAWDTLSQITETSSQLTETLSQLTQTSSQLTKTSSQLTKASEETETTPSSEVEEFSPPPTPGPSRSAISEAKRSIPRRTIPVKRSAQEAMCENISSAIQQFNERMSQQDAADSNFAKTIVEDIKILSPEEKLYFKKKMYDTLNEIVENRKK